MNTIHRRPGSFDSIFKVPAPRGIDDGRKKQSDEELLFDVESLRLQQVTIWDKLSTKSIYRWIEAGKIPVVKLGKRTYRIPARAVIAQLKAGGYELVVPENKQSQGT